MTQKKLYEGPLCKDSVCPARTGCGRHLASGITAPEPHTFGLYLRPFYQPMCSEFLPLEAFDKLNSDRTLN